MLCWCCVVCRWEGGTLGLALEPSHQSITRSHFKAPTHHNLHNTHHNSELSVQRKSNTRIKSDTQHKHNTHSLSVIHTHHYSVLFCSVLLCSVSHHTPPMDCWYSPHPLHDEFEKLVIRMNPPRSNSKLSNHFPSSSFLVFLFFYAAE